jgi:hypothetical protein
VGHSGTGVAHFTSCRNTDRRGGLQILTRFAMVRPMAEDHIEQGELTERFRAFAETVDPAPSRSLPLTLIVGGVVLVLALVAAVVFLLGS